ncbi:MAG: hypothetical protein JWM30_1466, partial [Burkholderia sp.]|nr:hypothetical protein [Burkholderia sp.]
VSDASRFSPWRRDRGRERRSPSPPSEPYVRFSRIRLSSWQLPKRDCLATSQSVCAANRQARARKASGGTFCLPRRRYQRRQQPVRTAIRFDPGSTPLWRLCTGLALSGTGGARACVFPSVLYPPSCLPSLSMVLLPTRSVESTPSGASSCRYYEGSDSCRHRRSGRSLRFSRTTFLAFRLQPRG